MNNHQYFLGVDGGGSKTTAVVFNEKGEFICHACGESINYYSVGIENARLAMKTIIDEIKTENFDCAVIGMSALNGRATSEETEKFCSGIINSDKIIMDSDLFVALEAMNEGSECAAVISGTGSMVVCRDKGGNISHAGGWGYILGDEGSGYAIGLAGIKAAIRAAENCAHQTALLGECLRYFAIGNIYDLIELYYEKGVSRKKTAAFAQVVYDCAQKGDAVSCKIIESEAIALSQTALGLLSKTRVDISVGLWGGVFQHNLIFKKVFCDSLGNAGFNNVKLINFTPEIGAIFAGYKASGIEITENIIQNIKLTYKA
ncbi:MAG: hypothetical protein IJ264_01290 [Clostridia bacterium]|nr:hypothetical protein [Clostridia bacterium]